ncbi:MAG: SIS domain-containing protein [Candidatus Marinimicrobia bacterium]|nr:SIS domain-containing protein [Candidatus Neomarinimicrobiota bacterium]
MDNIEIIKNQILASADTKKNMLDACSNDIHRAAEILINAVLDKRKILWCGNGGSAADSQHLSAELVGKLRHIRPAIASIALTTDTSFITAWANDTEFNDIFSRQIEALGKPGDVLIGISTSGNSPNIINAVATARELYLDTIVFSGGNGGRMKDTANIEIRIPSDDTQRIQEGHILVGHILCDLIERAISG